jgi:heme-degrading monooxygenase HmoA
VYVQLTTMQPNAGYEQHVVDSMHRFSAASRTQAGLQFTTTLRDPSSGELVGLAVWDSEESAAAAGPAVRAAVEGDDFDTWVAGMTNRRLEEI